jgi:hypothetical protein
MSNTKREPLLSDQSIRETFMYGSLILDAEHGFMSGANYARHEYEDARAKDAELIQRLVDALNVACNYAVCYEDAEFVKGADALSAAEAAGFKPSDR